MNELWMDLEHTPAQLFAKEDFLYLLNTAQDGLRKRHGEIEPEFAFYRKEETVRHPDPLKASSQVTRVPRLTVCYIRTEFSTHTGLAYCSNPDNPNKWYGKALAFKRAVLCLLNRDDYEEVYIRDNTDLSAFLESLGAVAATKSLYAPDSTYHLVPRVTEEETK